MTPETLSAAVADSGQAAKTVPVHVVGARGLLAGEFLRLLEAHPVLRLAGAYAREPQGTLRDCHPHLGVDHALTAPDGLTEALTADLARGSAVLLLALPHGASRGFWETLRSALGEAPEGLQVVDLSQDFRLEGAEPAGWPDWHYGLPELHPLPDDCARVAAPGCFATAVQLATVPAARAGLLAAGAPLVVNAVTGSSGSGAVPKSGTHHPHRDGDYWAYAVDGHRHEAEMLAPRNFPAGAPPLHFAAHSGPFRRGIHVSAVLPLADGVDASAVRHAYESAYAGAPFLQVLAAGATPHVRHVAGSNRVDLAVGMRHGAAQVQLALDNTLKGGAGQALQCLNLMLGLPQTAGLPVNGLGY